MSSAKHDLKESKTPGGEGGAMARPQAPILITIPISTVNYQKRGEFIMSFEGYYQILCRNGHLTIEDCYVFDEHTETGWVCPQCREPLAWKNLVDITNGSYDEGGNRIDGYVELKESRVSRCGHCGSVLEKTYEIPKKDEGKELTGVCPLCLEDLDKDHWKTSTYFYTHKGLFALHVCPACGWQWLVEEEVA